MRRAAPKRMDTAMTASAYQDPIASMVTMPLRGFVAPVAAPAPFVRPLGYQATHPAQAAGWATPHHQRIAMPAAAVSSDRHLQRLALGLLLTVVLLGIPLAAYLASMS